MDPSTHSRLGPQCSWSPGRGHRSRQIRSPWKAAVPLTKNALIQVHGYLALVNALWARWFVRWAAKHPQLTSTTDSSTKPSNDQRQPMSAKELHQPSERQGFSWSWVLEFAAITFHYFPWTSLPWPSLVSSGPKTFLQARCAVKPRCLKADFMCWIICSSQLAWHDLGTMPTCPHQEACENTDLAVSILNR